jgi:hypothetical protein
MTVKEPDSDHDSAQADGGHNDGKLSHLRWVLIGGAIAIAGLLIASIWWPNLTERTKFFTGNLLNLVIALAVIAQVLIYRVQARIMERQLRATELAANAAELSGKTAQDALRIGERPALGITKTTLTHFNPNGVPIAKIEVKNTGRVPARGVYVHTAMNIRPEHECPEPVLPTLMRKQSRSTITINAERHAFATTNERLSMAQYEGIRGGNLWLYVYAMIKYSDGRGGDYFTEYYARFQPLLTQFEDCPTHNDAD